MLVVVELFRPVVVGEVDVGPAVAVEIGRRGGERPTRAADAHPVGDVLELPVAEVVEEQVLSAVVGVLEALVHDPRRREVPEIDVVAEVRGDIEVELSVAIVVEPDRTVAVHPAVQAGALGDVLEVLAVDIAEEREVAVAIDENVLAAVVVDVTPDGAHRDAFAGRIEVSQTCGGGDVLEGAVAFVAIEGVRLAETAVGEVEIGPVVAVEVGNGNGSAERGDVRLDAGDLRIERRAAMLKVDAGLGSDVAQREARARGVGRRADRSAIQPHGEQDGGDERDGNDRASSRGARAGKEDH